MLNLQNMRNNGEDYPTNQALGRVSHLVDVRRNWQLIDSPDATEDLT